MFLLVETLCQKIKFFCTIVYASNSYIERRKLWRELGNQKIISNGVPWCILGDFNVSLKVEEHSNGSSTITNEMNEFLEVIQDIEVEDILSSGFHYTWTKSRMNPKCKTLKKLDRIMINEDFMEKFPSSHGIFLPYLISDHSPAVLKIPKGMVKRKKSFRFSNFVTEKKEFLPTVKRVWDTDIDGHMMYKVVKKLKLMKHSLNNLSWENGNIFDRVINLRNRLKESQARVNSNPHDEEIKDESGKILNEYYEALKDENSLLMQKAKIEWLRDGDRNTSFFHKIIKGRKHKGRIMSVCNEKGDRFENEKVAEQFVMHFQEFLGKKDLVTEFPTDLMMFPNKLSSDEAFCLSRDVNEVEVKNAMFDINDAKAPGPDGYTTSTTKFSININGEREGYFSGGRGLRQGDPMSPYLFTLIMEVFSLILERNIDRNNEFKYHHGCKNLKITHLCFADNLLVFCHGDIKSVSIIKEALEEFGNYSGLKANMITCENVIYDINKLLKGFLWGQGELTKGKAKVSWDSICKPKELGGLGIKDLKLWNEVLLVKQLWNVISKKNTMWVKWVISENLKGKNIWEANAKVNISVGWKEILKLRDKIRKHVLWRIGDDNSVNALYDNWNTVGPLNEIVTSREIYEACMNIDYTVAQLTMSEEGKWPNGWEDEYHILKMYKIPRLQEGKKDEIVWVDNSGKEGVFGTRHSFIVWLAIQNRLNTQDRIAKRKPNDILRLPNNKNIWSIVRKLVFGAVVYFIWQERNKRIFQEEKREEKTLVQIIKETVWLRLAGLVVKDSKTIKEVEDRWSVQFLRKKNRMIV
ncbi:RNA-directed DNA polymerase, eukaryota, reverse transcriptase zinc-binding domain protein [Tanacetum coccineum]|uniref:RNA-directed DNA polymerase, eukaryota, reverse transcriptase zinc-binding domain protein n=1 Tax=Tanacetum coccineum TaxID=301880 RepID=A0ABQ4YDQ5_9ASTR